VKRDLHFEAVYRQPPEQVWRALTEPRAIAAWLMPNDFEPRLGHRFQFRAPPQGGWDGIVNCEVLEIDPPRRLVYTWTSNMLDTKVAWTLERVGGGTRLRLDHTGFDGFKAWLVSLILGSGWKGMVAKRIAEVAEALARSELDAYVETHGGCESGTTEDQSRDARGGSGAGSRAARP
jgi:uncharacterized protein YndB with AHSA1/START domain